MGSNGKNESDSSKSLGEAVFQLVFSSYYDYLDSIVTFLEAEREKQNQGITEITEISEISEEEFGEVILLDELEPLPSELEYDFSRLASILEFENTLYSSFFVMIYFYLESELTRHCRDLEKKYQEKLSLSDIVGSGVQKAITYLIKVHHIDFSLGSSREWEKIQNYNILRNCIVHNQGRLDEGFDKTQKEKLLKFIQKPTSKLQMKYSLCVLNKDFCLDALDTIKSFLHSVLFAMVKTK